VIDCQHDDAKTIPSRVLVEIVDATLGFVALHRYNRIFVRLVANGGDVG
jgi:hypothetical protein